MTDDTQLDLEAEDGFGGESCPVCGRDFDQDEWEVRSQGGDSWGGYAIHECPTDGCEGTAMVNY